VSTIDVKDESVDAGQIGVKRDGPSIGLVLGTAAGADVQVRVGDSAGLESMSTAASMSNAHGTLHLPLSSPASARYVLIWFTSLPPNPSGTFQAEVWNVRLDGRA